MSAASRTPRALAGRTRGALVAAALAVALATLAFHALQQRPDASGGALSAPKAVWLAIAVYGWFFLAPLVALDAAVPERTRRWLGVFALAMWARGLVELALLYGADAWRPAYGIGHDLASALWLAAGLRGPLRPREREAGRLARPLFGLSLWLFATLATEAAFAWVFVRLGGGVASGPEALWFAPAGDPRFGALQVVTGWIDLAYGLAGAWVVAALVRAPADAGAGVR